MIKYNTASQNRCVTLHDYKSKINQLPAKFGCPFRIGVIEENNKKFINVVLKYDDRGRSVINELKRVSKPGRRVYQGKDEIKKFKNGYGTIIVSTSKGVLSNDEAHKAGVGGEVLCTVW